MRRGWFEDAIPIDLPGRAFPDERLTIAPRTDNPRRATLRRRVERRPQQDQFPHDKFRVARRTTVAQPKHSLCRLRISRRAVDLAAQVPFAQNRKDTLDSTVRGSWRCLAVLQTRRVFAAYNV